MQFKKQGHRSHVSGVWRFMKVKKYQRLMEMDLERLRRMFVIPGKLPGVVSSGVSTAGMVGSSFVIRDGLIKSKPKVNNSNTTNEHFSTKYVGK